MHACASVLRYTYINCPVIVIFLLLDRCHLKFSFHLFTEFLKTFAVIHTKKLVFNFPCKYSDCSSFKFLRRNLFTSQLFVRACVFYYWTYTEAILLRSKEMQQYEGVYLLQNYCTCFGCLSHPSSGVHQTVAAASGTAHSVRATTFLQRGLIRRRWRKFVAQVL